mmetsp:Transcript_12000/g.22942  ORF Transcript_12000/g.22942 Transcript_12000/m.22942 type:complete len:82 (-) Transcript_12000:308-553(-)
MKSTLSNSHVSQSSDTLAITRLDPYVKFTAKMIEASKLRCRPIFSIHLPRTGETMNVTRGMMAMMAPMMMKLTPLSDAMMG